jgi:hypothetical protein
MFYIYAHYKADDPNGLPFYIGKGKGKRDQSKHRNPYWKNISNKHGFIVKRLAENLTEVEAWDLEKKLIAHYGRLYNNTGCLCNLSEGGEGASGVIHTEVTKQKWSKAKQGKTWEEIFGTEKAAEMREQRKLNAKNHSDETKRKISESKKGSHNPMWGKKLSVEQRKKLSDLRKGKPSPNKGKKYSESARLNYKQAAILRSNDPTWRKKISESLTGITRSEETKQKMSLAAKLREEKKKLNKLKGNQNDG